MAHAVLNSKQLNSILANQERAIKWLMDVGLLKQQHQCQKCGGAMKLKKVASGDQCRWICRKKTCTGTCSIRTGSIFFNSKCSLPYLTRLLFEWAHASTSARATVEAGIDNIKTTIAWFATHNRINATIGEVFLERTAVRSGPVLMAIAIRHVEPGTLIITDCWRGYNGLRDSPFRHATVNHSRNFVDPNDRSINTQRVENVWRWLKSFLRRRGTNIRSNFDSYLAEWAFRREHRGQVFDQLVAAIARQTAAGNIYVFFISFSFSSPCAT
uniref:ISXO2-like transposase domain-containing protein n=1 Tax=Anopheles atroparvus TaxID=41427 RepID=A0A182JHF1_ANOAO